MKRKTVTFFFLLMFLLTCFVYNPRVEAQETKVYVDPERITGLDAGEEFRVEIKVANVTDLQGWEVKIFYKSSVLNASAVTPPTERCPFFNEEAPGQTQLYGVFNFTDHFNATHGQIIAYAALYDIGVSGSGTLLWVNFTAVGQGDSPIDISNVWGGVTILRDSNAQPIQSLDIDGVVHVGLRDVAVTGMEAPKGIPTDSVVRINVTAENQGEVSETFDVTLYYDSTPIETKSFVDMPGGGLEVVQFVWDTFGVPIGEYTMKATATEVPGEVDLNDNTYTFGFYIGIRDISITNVTPSKTSTNDTTVYIDVTIVNNGEPGTPSQAFDVTVYRNVTIIDTQAVTNLEAGAATTITFTWGTFAIPKGAYRLGSMATAVPGETNTIDNTYYDGHVYETLQGDVNGDFTVNIRDLYDVAKAFGATPGHSNWNANCDVDETGTSENKIDIRDLFAAARNFGKVI